MLDQNKDAGDPETMEMMRAAMRDAVRVVPRANVQAAAPFRKPKDLPAALGFAAVAIIAAGIGIHQPDRNPKLLGATPSMAKRGDEVTINGLRLCGPKAAPTDPCELDGAMVYVGDENAPISGATPGTIGTSSALVAAAAAATGPVAASVTTWTGGTITIEVPEGAAFGKTQLIVWAKGKKWGAVPFEVLRDNDPRAQKDNTVVLDPDDEAYMRELVADLKDQAKKDEVKALDEYAAKIEALIDQAEQGKITKEELLEQMKKAEEALNQGNEPDPEQITKDLAETGEELAKNELTKELGKALEKNDLEKARKSSRSWPRSSTRAS
jgi:hypothetical protein